MTRRSPLTSAALAFAGVAAFSLTASFAVAAPRGGGQGHLSGSGSSSSYGSGGSYAPAPSFSPSYQAAPVVQAPAARPGAADNSELSAQDENSARIQLRVPASATVWFDGELTKQTGSFRVFQTPDLDPAGEYRYVIKARWTDDSGREVIRTRNVTFHAGERMVLNFLQETSTKRSGPPVSTTSR